MRYELTQNKHGYWVTDEMFWFELKQKIEDVEDFGKQLQKYLKIKGLPFKTKGKPYLMFTDNRTDENLVPHYNTGHLFIPVREKSLKSRLNPFHDEIAGDETIVIEWKRGKSTFSSFQEYKSEYAGCRLTWKLPLDEIKAFKSMLERFASADDIYKLLLECAAEDE